MYRWPPYALVTAHPMLPDALQYLRDELGDHYADPWWWRHHLTECIHRYVNAPLQRLTPRHPDGQSIPEADWDSLIVLDACRADAFESVADLEWFDHYERRVSKASMTKEWMQKNFGDRELGDTVYVTTNPYTVTEAGDAFHHIEPLWNTHFDADLGTVPPKAVVSEANVVAEEFPEKRLIVHFVQPHHPFIADPYVSTLSQWDVDQLANGERPPHPHDPFEALSMGLLDRERVWKAYTDTLELVLENATTLADSLPGRTVLTADHGNMFGEPGWPLPLPVYGHPPGLRSPELTETPWAIRTTDDRPTITDTDTTASVTPGPNVQQRLQDLGYASE